jgi:hypothetical protein
VEKVISFQKKQAERMARDVAKKPCPPCPVKVTSRDEKASKDLWTKLATRIVEDPECDDMDFA